MRAQDIHKIVDAFTNRLDIPKYSRMVSFDEIEKNDFNLNLPRYIDAQVPEDIQDIDGHLRGGIPVRDVDRLESYWKVCPHLRHALFSANRPGYLDLTIDKGAIKPTIYGHAEFAGFIARMNAHFSSWREKAAASLRGLEAGCHPRQIIAELSEDLLTHYTGQPLIDKYDVYQSLMDYWDQAMQDDCYLIAADGWKAEPYRLIETKKAKDGQPGKQMDRGWTCDLSPKILIVARFFAREQALVDELDAGFDAIGAQIAELEDEHGGDDGLYSELEKFNAVHLKSRLKEIRGDKSAADEAEALHAWLALADTQADLGKRLKDAKADLDAKALAKYPDLSEDDIKALVVEDKWLAALDKAVHGEMDRISQALTRRVRELAERYETPLPVAAAKVAEMEARVQGHLERMGFAWNHTSIERSA